MPEVDYDPETTLVLLIPKQSQTDVTTALGMVLHQDGSMSVAGPLDSPDIIGRMFEGAWNELKRQRAVALKKELADTKILAATKEVMDGMKLKPENLRG